MDIVVIGESPAKGREYDMPILNGCQTGETWRQWSEQIGLNPEKCTYLNLYDANGNKCPVAERILRAEYSNRKPRIVFILGRKVSDFRKKKMVNHHNYFIELPHPSGRNRLLNNKDYICKILDHARNVYCNMPGKVKVWSYKEINNEKNI